MQNRSVPFARGLTLAALLGAGCSAPADDVAPVAPPATRFATAAEAADKLIAALRADDAALVHSILGPGAEELLDSGDEVADRNSRETFLAAWDEKHALVPAGEGELTLVVGSVEWPMPIPLVEEEGGGWYFDLEAGRDELLSRRIGRNELAAVQVCLAVVDAQREYASLDPDGDGVPEYARKILSDAGKRNGLFWPTQEGEPDSPLGPLAAEAAEEGYLSARKAGGEPQPYHGYFFRVLLSQGPAARGGALEYVQHGRMLFGFGLIAWPAEYAKSGLKTFLVNQDGVVFEKDLGEVTAEAVTTMTKFNPGDGWEAVK